MPSKPSRQYGTTPDARRQGPRAGGGASTYGERATDTAEPRTQKDDPSPPAPVVEKFHRHSDADVKDTSVHHTLGPTATQASPGDHKHDGSSSVLLLDGYILTGSKATPTTMWPSIIQCLVALGADDNTTA